MKAPVPTPDPQAIREFKFDAFWAIIKPYGHRSMNPPYMGQVIARRWIEHVGIFLSLLCFYHRSPPNIRMVGQAETGLIHSQADLVPYT